MQMRSITQGAAVLLALMSPVFAGSAHVVNNCGMPIYYASVNSPAGAGMSMLPAGGAYSEQFGAVGDGVSIKLSTSPNGDVTQFEYTNMGNGKVAYDMSNINGDPFAAGGMSLVPSMTGDSSNPSCVAVDCVAGAGVCNAAYNQPNDVDTKVCNSASDLTLTLCSSGSMKRAEPTAHSHRIHARHLPKRK